MANSVKVKRGKYLLWHLSWRGGQKVNFQKTTNLINHVKITSSSGFLYNFSERQGQGSPVRRNTTVEERGVDGCALLHRQGKVREEKDLLRTRRRSRRQEAQTEKESG